MKPKTKWTTSRRHPALVPTLALAWVAVALPAIGQPFGGAEAMDVITAVGMADEELDGSYAVRDVPYAMLVDALFGAMVHSDAMGGWWSNHGLDPDSRAVKELQSLAREVERAHPKAVGSPAEESSPEEIEAVNARLRERLDGRYRALGVAFGEWLENRRSEGYPPEFFLDRIVSGIGVAAFSTESVESVRRDVTRNATEFEAGLRQSMETVPLRLTVSGSGRGED